RLEYQTGDPRLQRFGLDLLLNDEAIGESYALNFQIQIQKLQFPFEGHLVLAGVVQGEPQQFAQSCDHSIRGLGVPVYQSRNRMQSVEEKMGVQLHLQRLEPGPGKVDFQPRRLKLSFTIPLVIIECVTNGYNQSIGQKPQRQVEREDEAEEL